MGTENRTFAMTQRTDIFAWQHMEEKMEDLGLKYLADKVKQDGWNVLSHTYTVRYEKLVPNTESYIECARHNATIVLCRWEAEAVKL